MGVEVGTLTMGQAKAIMQLVLGILADQREQVIRGVGDAIEMSKQGWIEQGKFTQHTELVEWLKERQKVHTHNSIPSFIADLDEGCIICVKNQALQETIDHIAHIK